MADLGRMGEVGIALVTLPDKLSRVGAVGIASATIGDKLSRMAVVGIASATIGDKLSRCAVVGIAAVYDINASTAAGWWTRPNRLAMTVPRIPDMRVSLF